MSAVYESWLGRTTVTADLRLPAAWVSLLSFDFVNSDYHLLHEDDTYRLDLSLDARLSGTGLHFENRWVAHRYERPGRLFLLPPGETLRVRSGVGCQDAIICHLPIRRMRQWLERDIQWSERRLEASVDIPSAVVGDLLVRLGEEAKHPGFASTVLIESLAIQIAVMLERHFRDLPEHAPAGGLSARHIRSIEERVRDGTSTPTASELAALCGISVRHLSRGFQISHGISLGRYVAQVRIEQAKRRLLAGESVKAVAYRMGFGTPSSFSYAFRKATGLSPGRFRASPRIVS